MKSLGTTLHPVVDALRERLRSLDAERDALAYRARQLEAELAEVSAEARRRASEAVQLQSLLDFYESDRGRGRGTSIVTTAPAPAADPPADDAMPAAPAPVAAASAPEAELPARVEAAADAPAAPTARAAGQHRSAAWAAAWREAAIAALREQGGPVHYRELHRILASRGFAFGGKSPEATFLSSLNRDRASFQAAGRGTYWLAESPDGQTVAVAGRVRRRTTRPRPIGRPKKGGKQGG